MNLKHTLLSALAAGSLLLASTGVSAQDTQTIPVTVNDAGVLEIQFGTPVGGPTTFGEADVTTVSGEKLTTDVTLWYNDTKVQRGAFSTSLSASSFTSETSGSIPASNLTIKAVKTFIGGNSGEGIGVIQATNGVSPQAYVNNTPWQGGDLSTSPVIAVAQAGAGTSHPFPGITEFYSSSTHTLTLELTVPAGQQPGDYETTLTVSINPANP